MRKDRRTYDFQFGILTKLIFQVKDGLTVTFLKVARVWVSSSRSIPRCSRLLVFLTKRRLFGSDSDSVSSGRRGSFIVENKNSAAIESVSDIKSLTKGLSEKMDGKVK